MDFDGIELHFDKGIWVGMTATKYGLMELVLDGTKDAPKEGHVVAVRRFLAGLEEAVAKMRQNIPWGFLYRPIRIAPNNEDRVGIQFRHRLTGYQGHLILEDKRV